MIICPKCLQTVRCLPVLLGKERLIKFALLIATNAARSAPKSPSLSLPSRIRQSHRRIRPRKLWRRGAGPSSSYTAQRHKHIARMSMNVLMIVWRDTHRSYHKKFINAWFAESNPQYNVLGRLRRHLSNTITECQTTLPQQPRTRSPMDRIWTRS